MSVNRLIIVAVLDWGMGHATRCVPVVRKLLERGYEVLLIAEGSGRKFLEDTFPQLEILSFPGYEIVYPKKGEKMYLRMIGSVPGILKGIKQEHELLNELVEKRKPIAIISDNRFGMWHPGVFTVFITHQVNIRAPIGESIVGMMNRKYIRKFNLCWIPDHSGENNLSGDLGHHFRQSLNATYIGPLSRFSGSGSSSKDIDVLMMLSGPEPQRSIFEELLLIEAEKVAKIDPKLKLVMLRGKPGEGSKIKGQGIQILDHAKESELQDLMGGAKLIVSRSGYSTIMDINRVGGKAVFVATPGQTEQEYLADRFMEKGIALKMKQGKIDLGYAMASAKNYKGFPGEEETGSLDKALNELNRFLQGKRKD